MHSYEQPSFPLDADVVWIEGGERIAAPPATEPDCSVGEMAAELDVTPRTLRFYESKGLISPTRREGMRLYGKADRARLALILKAKKLGFTLAEIREMIDAQDGAKPGQSLKLSLARCSEQIDLLERQRAEVDAALAELRRMHTMLTQQGAGRRGT